MNHAALKLLILQRDLHRALNVSELSVSFQPKFSVASQAVTGVEALIRWHHPELGESCRSLAHCRSKLSRKASAGRWPKSRRMQNAAREASRRELCTEVNRHVPVSEIIAIVTDAAGTLPRRAV